VPGNGGQHEHQMPPCQGLEMCMEDIGVVIGPPRSKKFDQKGLRQWLA